MTTIVQKAPSSSAGVQPPTFGGVGTSTDGNRLTSHVSQSEPHVYKSCGKPFYGPGPRHGTSMMTGAQVKTLLKLYYCSIFNFSVLYVTY